MPYKHDVRDIVAMVMPQLVGSALVAPRYAEFWYRVDDAGSVLIGRVLELKIGVRLIRGVQGVRIATEHQRFVDTSAYRDLFSDDGETVGFLQSMVLSRVQALTLEEVIAPFQTESPLYTSGVKTLPDNLAEAAHGITSARYVPEIEKIFEGLSDVEGESAPL